MYINIRTLIPARYMLYFNMLRYENASSFLIMTRKAVNIYCEMSIFSTCSDNANTIYNIFDIYDDGVFKEGKQFGEPRGLIKV